MSAYEQILVERRMTKRKLFVFGMTIFGLVMGLVSFPVMAVWDSGAAQFRHEWAVDSGFILILCAVAGIVGAVVGWFAGRDLAPKIY
jgi:hypothetical protein